MNELKSTKDYIWFKLIALLFSRKFIVLAIVVALSFGLQLHPDVQAAILLVAGVTFSLLTYLEDKARLGQSVTLEEILDKIYELLDIDDGEADTPK